MSDKTRTLKEIEQSDYDGLTYGEFVENNLDCKKHCPLYGEFCNGGFSCYGGIPIEPPCCNFEESTILDEVADNYEQARTRQEKKRDEDLAKEEARISKNNTLAIKRREYRARNIKELLAIKALKNTIKNEKVLISLVENFIQATNTTNRLFRESGDESPSDVKLSPALEERKARISEYEAMIENFKETIKYNEANLKEQV